MLNLANIAALERQHSIHSQVQLGNMNPACPCAVGTAACTSIPSHQRNAFALQPSRQACHQLSRCLSPWATLISSSWPYLLACSQQVITSCSQLYGSCHTQHKTCVSDKNGAETPFSGALRHPCCLGCKFSLNNCRTKLISVSRWHSRTPD